MQRRKVADVEAQVAAFAEHCRKSGLSVTRQRLAIFEALAASREHPSAEDIHRAVRKRLPHLSLATVYKNLESLREIGAVSDVNALHEHGRYEAALPDLFARFNQHRTTPLSGPAEGDLLVEVSRHVSRFVGKLFRVSEEQAQLKTAAGREAPIFRVKREFVQRRVFKKGATVRPAADEFPVLDDGVQPLLAAAAARDPRASQAPGDLEFTLALVVDTLLDAARAPEQFRTLREAMARGLADRGEQPEWARDLRTAPTGLAERLLDLFD